MNMGQVSSAGPQGSPVIKEACCLLGLVPRMRQQAATLPLVPPHSGIRALKAGRDKGRGRRPAEPLAGAGVSPRGQDWGSGKKPGFSSGSLGRGGAHHPEGAKEGCGCRSLGR